MMIRFYVNKKVNDAIKMKENSKIKKSIRFFGGKWIAYIDQIISKLVDRLID